MDHPIHKWRVSRKEAGMRLLQFLRKKCPNAPSVKTLKRALDGKLCTVNDRIETFSSYILEENDIVNLNKTAFETNASIKSIPILFEDEELIIINKPHGIVADARLFKKGLNRKSLHLVHRLDKETSGALILAKTAQAKEKMIELFKKRKVKKVYLAIVDGSLDKSEGKMENYLGKKSSYQGQTIYGSVDPKKGLRAITYWKVLQKTPTASLVCCEPYTGRTHQLRAHFCGIGHPILGDVQYGKKFRCSFNPQRNLLHAYSIAFEHPKTKKDVKIIAPIPADFKKAMEFLKIRL